MKCEEISKKRGLEYAKLCIEKDIEILQFQLKIIDEQILVATVMEKHDMDEFKTPKGKKHD